jgi:hypothetical protein
MEIRQQDCDSTGTLQEAHHPHMLPTLPTVLNREKASVIVKPVDYLPYPTHIRDIYEIAEKSPKQQFEGKQDKEGSRNLMRVAHKVSDHQLHHE